MDLNTVTEVVQPRCRAELRSWQQGDAFLAGGSWLFPEPQPSLTRLVDLVALDWPPLEITATGLRIAATCTLAQLAAMDLPPAWRAAPLFRQCCRALLGSFKIWNAATVGGNLCMALPAGPMAALCVALDGDCTIWTPSGGQRSLPVGAFVVGPNQNALEPGELLRAIDLPAAALQRRTAFRQISLTPLGRSTALLIGTVSDIGDFALTITAATRRPFRIELATTPDASGLRQALETTIPDAMYYDDLHGTPDWRRAMTFRLADEIRQELLSS